MCQCHKIWQNEGDMQVQVAHSKNLPLGKKNSYIGLQLFVGGYRRKERGSTKKIPPPTREVNPQATWQRFLQRANHQATWRKWCLIDKRTHFPRCNSASAVQTIRPLGAIVVSLIRETKS